MSDEKKHELERQLEAERERARLLEAKLAETCQEKAVLQNQLENYKPMAEQWMREHGPSREECEKILTDMLDHPETWVDAEDVIKELERDFGDPRE